MIPAKSPSTPYVSMQPLRCRPGGEVPQRVIQREGKWSLQSLPRYIPGKTQRTRVSGRQRTSSRVRVLYGAKNRSIDATSELGYANGFVPLGFQSSETACVRAPASRLGGGRVLDRRYVLDLMGGCSRMTIDPRILQCRDAACRVSPIRPTLLAPSTKRREVSGEWREG